ncbi:MAG: HD domain-containing protein [Candidatus Lokiarchaeota archaeon]|nr:HD domain-containing protein [Candidatus Lokiarchaeota archaeon]
MKEDKIISMVKEFAIKNSENNDIHGFDHVERVYRTSVSIGEKLNADLRILKISALLHDIGRIQEKKDLLKRNHAEISADLAENFLASIQYDLSQNDIDKISHCIQAHSFSNNLVAETLEAKILSDADKLDALGAIGLYRTIGFNVLRNGGLNNVIKHLENKILKLKNQLFLDISKEIALSREKIIINFYDKIKELK